MLALGGEVTPSQIKKIRAMAAELVTDGIVNSAGGASCGVLCEEMSIFFDCDMTYGSVFDCNGNLIDDDHAWLILPDGSIVDPTVTQFKQIEIYPGVDEIAIIPPAHCMQAQYVA